jgi:fibronectin type 3 domain-containing protein
MLYRATSPRGTYRLLTTTSALGYTNRRVATGATYYYKVRAYRLTGGARVYGAYSATAAIKTSLSASSWAKAARASAGSVKVTWAKVAGATKYEVWRAPAAGAAFTRAAAVSGTVWVNTGLTAGNTYFYKVKAYRLVSGRKVYGGFSRVVSAKP